jgi:hypothetical protein
MVVCLFSVTACEVTDDGTDSGMPPGDGGGGTDSPITMMDTGPSCAAHRVGSCVSTDGLECVNFDGSFFTPSNSPGFCMGTFQADCGCDDATATGICVMAVGTLNESTEYYYDTDVSEELLDCLTFSGEWTSTPSTPDLTWVCEELPRSFSSFGATVSDCGKRWNCGETGRELEIACDRNTSGATPTYDCTCTEDGTETGTFSNETICGTTTGTDEENDALLVTGAMTGCTWEVTDDPDV